ncbi:MAG: glycosyl hydrolase family 39 [Ferruginibacter sp.]
MNISKLMLLAFFVTAIRFDAESQAQLNIQWDKPVMVSRSVPTLQVVVNPPLRRGSAIHDQSFAALKKLGADYVRYVPWLPYPRLGVAELEPPANGKTSWDFTHIDPITIDFLEATKGHPVILNFSTIPAWFYKTDKPVTYPANPEEVIWNYTQGSELKDSTARGVADYYARLFSWYTKGGFTDELGKFHSSGHHYSIPYWEVLNEPDLEHNPTSKQYATMYDAVTSAIKKISPHTKFVGMSLAFENDPGKFEYFLNPKNHKPGVPLDMISYHFYATSIAGQTTNDMQYTYFERADNFINRVRYIENIRRRLSPKTKTTINEVGSILHNEETGIDPAYWNLSGGLYAYLYLELTKLGIDIIGESQLVGYPSQFPSVSMMNWTNGNPNARYWVLKLLKDNFGPGDVLVQTDVEGERREDVSMQAFKTGRGNKILIINKRNKNINITFPDSFKEIKLNIVDISTGDNEPMSLSVNSKKIELKPYAVAVVTQ